MMVHKLLRLHGDEDWEAWGRDWWDRADVICDVECPTDRDRPPEWLHDREGRWLERGVKMHEVSRTELGRLIAPRLDIRKAWHRLVAGHDERPHGLLASLSDAGRYAVVWIECR